jgi:hypothetical protein
MSSKKEEQELKGLLDKIKKDRLKEQQEYEESFRKEQEKYLSKENIDKPKTKKVYKKPILEEDMEEATKKTDKKDITDVLERIEKIQKGFKEGKKEIEEMYEKPKKAVIKRKIPIEAIKTHLSTLPHKQLKDIARASNLHTRIKLSSPRNVLVDAICKLYEWENGKYKSKPFTLDV